MKKVRSLWSLPVLLASVLFLAGCGSAPPIPTEKLTMVETAIAEAKEKEAYTHAAAEINQAEKKLEEAKALIAKEEYEQARLLLDQAEADAKLAESKADAERARGQAEEMRDTVDTLRQELDRTQ